MDTVQKNNDFDKLISSVYQTHCLLQENAVKSINFNLTIRNWLVGCYIVEYEQKGKDRAQYGTGLLEEMAKQIKDRKVKGLNERALRNCRMFYLIYPQIRQTVFGEFEKLVSEHNFLLLNDEFPIRQTLSAEFQQFDNQELQIHPMVSDELLPIRRTLSAEFQEIDKQPNRILQMPSVESLPIRQTPSAELEEDNYPLSSYQLLSRLSFSHFIELIQVEDSLQRLFYEVEAIKNNWSVRELARAIDTSLAFRTTLSTDKEAVIKKIKFY